MSRPLTRKPDHAWGIRQYGMFLPFLTRSTRKGAILDCCSEVVAWGEKTRTWAQLRRRGYTVHKLEIRNA